MPTFILIFYMGSAYSGGPTTAEFIGKDACESAGRVIMEKWPRSMLDDRVKGYVCVPKLLIRNE